MIEVKPDFTGKSTYTFVASTDKEKKFLEENSSKILDKFISKYFINNKTTNIHTLNDFFLFCTDYEFCLERYYGHPVKEIGQLEKEDFALIQQECTSELGFNVMTESRLQKFVNDLYIEASKKKDENG